MARHYITSENGGRTGDKDSWKPETARLETLPPWQGIGNRFSSKMEHFELKRAFSRFGMRLSKPCQAPFCITFLPSRLIRVQI